MSNALILKNMCFAVREGVEVLPRIPVIPGFNDSLDDAKGFCETLATLGLTRAQLLPFHQFGEKKYEQLGLEYTYREKKPLREQDLVDYQTVFAACGIQAFL